MIDWLAGFFAKNGRSRLRGAWRRRGFQGAGAAFGQGGGFVSTGKVGRSKEGPKVRAQMTRVRAGWCAGCCTAGAQRGCRVSGLLQPWVRGLQSRWLHPLPTCFSPGAPRACLSQIRYLLPQAGLGRTKAFCRPWTWVLTLCSSSAILGNSPVLD